MENKESVEWRTYLKSPDGNYFDSRRKAIMHMMASQFQSQMMTIDDNQMPIDKD